MGKQNLSGGIGNQNLSGGIGNQNLPSVDQM
jgi:hypothetical protein